MNHSDLHAKWKYGLNQIFIYLNSNIILLVRKEYVNKKIEKS